MYMLIEFHCGLPWQKEKTRERLETIKLGIPDNVLMKHFPGKLPYATVALIRLFFQKKCMRFSRIFDRLIATIDLITLLFLTAFYD